jgi:hypothetical protein
MIPRNREEDILRRHEVPIGRAHACDLKPAGMSRLRSTLMPHCNRSTRPGLEPDECEGMVVLGYD